MGFSVTSSSRRWIFALIFGLWALYSTKPVYGQVQSSFHVIPQIADGTFPDGTLYGSAFFVTNVNNTAVTCSFTPYGVPASRFISLSFSMPSGTGNYYTTTNLSGPLVTGYATLSCSNTVTVNTVYLYGGYGQILSMATVFSAPPFMKASVSGIQTSVARVAIAIANNSSTTVQCQIIVNTSPSGTVTGQTISIAPYSNVAKFVDELVSLPTNAGPMIVYLVADQPLYAIGLMYSGKQFTTLPPTIYY
jgi:hypothetical protein